MVKITLIFILFFIGLISYEGKAQVFHVDERENVKVHDTVKIIALIKSIKKTYEDSKDTDFHGLVLENVQIKELSKLVKKLSNQTDDRNKKYVILGQIYINYFKLIEGLKARNATEDFLDKTQELIETSKKNKLDILCSELYLLRGHYYSKYKNDYRNSIVNNQSSIKYAIKSEDTITLVNGYNSQAMNYSGLNRNDKAIEFLHKSLRLLKNPEQKYTTYVNIGDMYRNIGEYDKSLLSLQKAEAIFLTNNMDIIYGINLDLKYAGIYTRQKKYKKADERIMHAQKSEESSGNSMFAGRIFYEKGKLYFEQENYLRAIEEFEKSIYFQKKNKFSNRDIKLYNALGKSYYCLDSLDRAKGTLANMNLLQLSKSYYLKSLALLPANQVKENKKEVYKALKKIYILEGNYKSAFAMLEMEQVMADSINNFEARAKFIEQEISYEFERKREADSLGSVSEKLLMQAKIGQKKAENRLLYLSLVAVGLMLGLVIVRFRNEKRKRQIQLEKQNALIASKEKEILQSELAFLKAQINPHFLFNVINAIYFKINKNDEEAREALHGFSNVLRYQLYECNQPKVAIEKEIKYLNEYIRLQLLRNPDKINVQLDISDTVSGFEISPLLLFPFVENAFKYHVEQKEKGNTITVRLHKEAERFVFFISNSYDPESNHGVGGIGLSNVRRRLELLYDGKYTMDINTSNNQYTVTLILIIE